MAMLADGEIGFGAVETTALILHLQATSRRSSGLLGSLEDRRNRAMNDRAVPTLSVPPSILAVDLDLQPGESKTCTYFLH